jgi:hypothetical protein
MRIEEERGDLLIDIPKNLLQRGQCVLKNMPRIRQRRDRGGVKVSEGEGNGREMVKEGKEEHGRKRKERT